MFNTEITYTHPETEEEYTIRANVTPIVPAKTYGPPEMCSPAEGGEIEDLEIFLYGKRVKTDPFTEEDMEKIYDLLLEEGESSERDRKEWVAEEREAIKRDDEMFGDWD